MQDDAHSPSNVSENQENSEQQKQGNLGQKFIQGLNIILGKNSPGSNVLTPQSAQSLINDIKSLKQNYDVLKQDHKIFQAFAQESISAGIEHFDDAYKIADFKEVKVNAETQEITGIKEVIKNLKEQSPHLFKLVNPSTSELPYDYSIDFTSQPGLDDLKHKASQSGSVDDMQKYWAARRDINSF